MGSVTLDYPLDDDIFEEFWLLIIILSLENLRCFEVRHFGYGFWDLTIKILEKLISTPGYTALKNLEEVNILSETISQNFGAAKFASFSKLPPMRVFRASVHEEHEEWYAMQSFPGLHPRPKPSPIRQIILKNSNCQFGMVEYISLCAQVPDSQYHEGSI